MIGCYVYFTNFYTSCSKHKFCVQTRILNMLQQFLSLYYLQTDCESRRKKQAQVHGKKWLAFLCGELLRTTLAQYKAHQSTIMPKNINIGTKQCINDDIKAKFYAAKINKTINKPFIKKLAVCYMKRHVLLNNLQLDLQSWSLQH